MALRVRLPSKAAAFVSWLCACPLAWAGPLFKLGPESPVRALDGNAGVVTWEQVAARCGGTAMRITPAAGGSRARFQVPAEPRLLATPGLYRVEAWIRTDKRNCDIDFVLYDSDTGKEWTRSAVAARSDASRFGAGGGLGGWQYRAHDVFVDNDCGCLRYNIEVSVSDGPVLIDQLKVADSASILPHGDFTELELNLPAQPAPATTTGASLGIPRGWRRTYHRAAAGGEPEGFFGVEKDAIGNMLVVRKVQGEFSLSAEPIAIPRAAKDLVASVRLDGHPRLMPTAVLCQYGRGGLLKEDRSDRIFRAAGETLLSTGRARLQPGAERVLLLLRLPSEPGTCRVRSVEVSSPERASQEIEILVDQVGYDVGEPLRLIVAAPSFPTGGPATFRLADTRGKSHDGPLVPLGRAVGQNESDWGCYYFEGVLADPAPGTYALTVQLGGRSASIERLAVGPQLRVRETGELAYRFYSVQRCGCAVPGYHGPCHMDDAKLPDGSHVDVTGGYHSAGDFHKHMGDNAPVSVYGMARAYEAHKSFFDAIDRDANGRADLLDEAVWGADWLRKMVNPKTGRFWANVTNDIDYYGLPDQETDGIPGTADDRAIGVSDSPDHGPFAIAAWAVLSRHVPGSGHLNLAEKLWAAYEDQALKGYNPRYIFAALELAHSTGLAKYRSACRRLVPNLLALQDGRGWFASSPNGGPEFRIVDEGTTPAALACYALAEPDSPLVGRVKDALRRYFAWSLRMGDNPFGVIRNSTGGEPFFFKGREAWFGGGNSQYCSTAWAAYLASQVFPDEPEFSSRLRNHAANQMHWILGTNPLKLCMFEGKGNSSRICYHHMFVEVPGHPRGDVPGAIPNGLTRDPSNADRPWFDLRSAVGSLPGAESAEPWGPHNAYYLLMLSAMPASGSAP